MEAYQETDSGYLNSIGLGNTYIKKQIERFLNQNIMTADHVMYDPHINSIDVWTDNVKFKKKEK